MSDPETARLLPWRSEEGKPCFLAPGGEGGFLWQLADEMEAVQLTMGTEVLNHARKILSNANASKTELRYVGARLSECLCDALRVAESRGARLPETDCESAAEVSS
ncbi:hypothetical protein [Streptomyces rhizosphaericus]|uniref:Uncharacterized protein n=1 Tax=Streptomyces rhizosphaericus TaxID=114699 RepID=A0A6G4AUV2_9ACTN|nr:hypothetical protein [Streptomyces rhizosphaericus]NEW76247.1 hypothetical protein [Streptomyces rhizosphaericus]